MWTLGMRQIRTRDRRRNLNGRKVLLGATDDQPRKLATPISKIGARSLGEVRRRA